MYGGSIWGNKNKFLVAEHFVFDFWDVGLIFKDCHIQCAICEFFYELWLVTSFQVTSGIRVNFSHIFPNDTR